MIFNSGAEAFVRLHRHQQKLANTELSATLRQMFWRILSLPHIRSIKKKNDNLALSIKRSLNFYFSVASLEACSWWPRKIHFFLNILRGYIDFMSIWGGNFIQDEFCKETTFFSSWISPGWNTKAGLTVLLYIWQKALSPQRLQWLMVRKEACSSNISEIAETVA